MAKNVFRPYEFTNKLTDTVAIKPPTQFQPVEAETAVKEEEYTGPTADDLRREAEAFREQWASERLAMIQEADETKTRMLEEAEAAAFDIVKKEKEQATQIRIEAEKEAQKIIAQGEASAKQREAETQQKVKSLEETARKSGFEQGYEEGYATGKEEVERLVERIHVIMDKIIAKRQEIIENSETQVVQLVLMVAKKVVKVISENQRNVVINNVLQGLRKLKTRGDVVVRVNLEDLKVTSDHVKEFLKLVENVKSITVMEDSTVDLGGCVIETDFGEIDARISSQFNEIEEKILEMVPIKTKVTEASSSASEDL
ncbi:MAG: flagellar assembly protein FliH [Spirochaetales bacterium]|nr:flagellar assembly protein FliH [Spirochaetales bacterium]